MHAECKKRRLIRACVTGEHKGGGAGGEHHLFEVDPALVLLAWKLGRAMNPQEISILLYASALLGLRPKGSSLFACLDHLCHTCHTAGPQARIVCAP
jgi:hypothetical protein